MAPITFGNGTDATSIVWTNWASTDTETVVMSSSSTSNDVWIQWAGTGTGGTSLPALSEEETALRLASQQFAYERRQRDSTLRRERARALLEDGLAQAQRKELRDRGYFHVETRDGRRRYRLSPGMAPLRISGEDGRQWSYCIHPANGFPAEDVVLAQKLLLETDEDEFLRIANASVVTVQ